MKSDTAMAGAGSPGEDLSHEVCLAVAREPGDIVRCTRVGERNYRCNWWRSVFVDSFDQPGTKGGQLGTTYRVARSAFLEVVRTSPGLRMTVVTPRARSAFDR